MPHRSVQQVAAARRSPGQSQRETWCSRAATRRWCRLFPCVIGGLLTLLSPQRASADASTSEPASASEASLPPLPAVPKLEIPAPERLHVEELATRIQHLISGNAEERSDALAEVFETRAKLIPALYQRFETLAGRADRERMKRAMLQVREQSKASRTRGASADTSGESRTDLLAELLEQPKPNDEGWRDLTELVAISRMFAHIGNVYAARGLIEIYVRFGEFMRVDVQNRLFDLRDGAVAALIEARRHRAEKIARWAERQLDRLGKGVPGEAIRTTNFDVLADILRAYGRVKDRDAARIVISYASSERFRIREAARQAIAMLGEVGIWQLREAYEGVSGKRPRRDWSWERTARELFFEYDKLHVAKIYELLDKGSKAAAEGRFEEMAKDYDAILTRAPQFDRADALAPGYFTFAQRIANSQPAAAEAALVRVERLTNDVNLRQRAKSLRDTIRAEQQLLQRGIMDTYLLNGAIERDPNNHRARELLRSADRAKLDEQTRRMRWLTSGAIALVAAIAILFVLLRRREAPLAVGAQPLSPSERDATPAGEGSTPSESERVDSPESARRQNPEADWPRSTRDPLLPHPTDPQSPQDSSSSEAWRDLDAPPVKRRDPFEDL